jgi:hypothetical protein
MATRTISAAGGNSNVAATYDENAVPTASDDIVARADGTSGNLAVAAALACRSIDLTTGSVSGGAYTGTVSGASGISIGTSTAPPSGVALRLAAGVGWTASGNVAFVTTHTTAQTVTMAGKTLGGSMSVSGAGAVIHFADAVATGGAVTCTTNGGTLKLLAAMTVPPANNVTLTNGTLDINGQALTGGSLLISNNSNTRVLALGSGGSITPSAAAGVTAQGTVTNFSTSGSGTITLTASAAVASLRGADWSGTTNGITIDFTGAGINTLNHGTSGTAVGTVGNLQRHGTAVKTSEFVVDGDVTVGGNLTLTGNSRINQLLVRTSTRGTGRTITCNGTVTVTNTDFRDITGAGSGSWDFSAQTDVGNALGNSGVTFPAAATQTTTTNFSNWTTATWTSRLPLPQDDVVASCNTFTMDMPRYGRNINLSGCTGATGVAVATSGDFHGDLTLPSATTPMSGTGILTFVGRGSHTITSNGNTFTGLAVIDAVVGVGTYTLADAFTSNRSSAGVITLTSGTFDANDKSITLTGAAASVIGTAGTLQMGNGTWSLTGTTARTFWAIAAACTITAEGSTVSMDASTANTMTFQAGAGGGKVYNVVRNTAPFTGVFLISNSITAARYDFTGCTLRIAATGTIFVVADGTFKLRTVTLDTSVAGSAATISAPA